MLMRSTTRRRVIANDATFTYLLTCIYNDSIVLLLLTVNTNIHDINKRKIVGVDLVESSALSIMGITYENCNKVGQNEGSSNIRIDEIYFNSVSVSSSPSSTDTQFQSTLPLYEKVFNSDSFFLLPTD